MIIIERLVKINGNDKTHKEQKCPECGGTSFQEDEHRAELVCRRCGFVTERELSFAPEWTAYEAQDIEKKARTGAPVTLKRHDQGMSTEIGRSNYELSKVSVRKRRQYMRMRKMDKWITKAKDRTLALALYELARQVSYLGLPDSIHNEVARLFREVMHKGLLKRKKIEAVVAALVYMTARKQANPRTLLEISMSSGIKEKDITQIYKKISRELKIKILPVRPSSYVPRFASLLGLSGPVQSKATEILNSVEEDVISGKDPLGVVAAALYLAAAMEGEKRSQSEIAEAIGISNITIRKRYYDLVGALGIEKESENKFKSIAALNNQLAEKQARASS